ncbi:MAG: hypothetical protein ABIP79_01595 [Chitinophagaceae bacterium]
MKVLITILGVLFCSVTVAQSPSLSVRFSMDKSDVFTTSSNFKIEMKICEPIKKTEKGGWFTNDTSSIHFSSLTAADITCDKYSEEGEGIEVLSGEKIGPKYNSYSFSNQYFAWEYILIFKITNESSRGLQPPMYVILPVKYKSFFTSVNITNVFYESDTIVFIDNAVAKYPNKRLTINHSLKNETGIIMEKSLYKDWIAN